MTEVSTPVLSKSYGSNMKLEIPELALEKVAIPDLRRLKELSDRLRLSPKRESVLQWQNDIKELQSEGMYLIPAKNKRNADFAEKSCCGAPSFKTRARRKLDVTREDPELESSACSRPYAGLDSAPEIKITPTGDGSDTQQETRMKSSVRKKYFCHRSSEECQQKIKDYALRMDLETNENSFESALSESNGDKPSVKEQYKRIGIALERIRTDLLDMRIHDNTLARQLLDQRRELLQVKAQKSCEEHATMIEDFSFELEHEEELTEQLRSFDLPSAFLRGPNSLLVGTSPLRLVGISRMTLDSKRFSVI